MNTETQIKQATKLLRRALGHLQQYSLEIEHQIDEAPYFHGSDAIEDWELDQQENNTLLADLCHFLNEVGDA